MGRKKTNIEWKKIENMAVAGCNGQQISAAMGIHYNTLARRCQEDNKCDFSEYLQTKKEKGNNLLKQKQFDLALKGDRGMLIWLGKNRLGQSDKKEITQENLGQNIKVEFTSTNVKPKLTEADFIDD
tara:strand:- start:71 stop:451 length:381 start_codon:yes stop_codon:yes gene_type:complete